MYETAVGALEKMRLRRYEISNFARPGFESRHNLKYWRLEPYAGFGADAHSFDNGLRFQNVETAAQYVERSERGEGVRAAETPSNASEEKFFVGLRLSEGVRPDREEWRMYKRTIERFVADGLLQEQNGAIRLTDRGVLVSNEIFQEFIHCG
jgi:oxygen-independent coproporphyrinogen-3 oxidase